MSRRLSAVLAGMLLIVGCCAMSPKGAGDQSTEQFKCWKVKQSRLCDYYEYFNGEGRVIALGYDDDQDGMVEVRIDLQTVRSDPGCPHDVILLDGLPYVLVKELYDQGKFRLFYPPSKLITCFPSMTDLAYGDVFTPGELYAYEAVWYDRQQGKVCGGKGDYLAQKNAPWQRYLEYRAAMLLDAVGYLFPNYLFNKEMAGIEKAIDRKQTGTCLTYSVGTATVGTRKGREGLIKCLERVDELCQKLVYERRGRCQITLLADHGHNLAASEYFPISKALKDAAFKVTGKLKTDNDVVVVEFGLVTYSAVYTNRPERVADALIKRNPINLAIYPDSQEKNWIVVRSRDGAARITKTDKGYIYRAEKGDPLLLKGIIEKLTQAGKVTAAGEIDDRALFLATVDHEYPDPLARIYRAFNGLVKFPPDLIVTLKDGWFAGASDLAGSVSVESTHGALSGIQSVPFIMSTIEPLPPAIRTTELREVFPQILPDALKSPGPKPKE